MSPQTTAAFSPGLGLEDIDKFRKRGEKAREEAVAAAKEIEKNSATPCPLDVQQLCRQTEQDDFEKEHDIAPGCGYYRRRHDNFVLRNPDLTPPEYYLQYGEKYCNRFTRETYDELSPEGQKWFDGVKCGLQQGIEDILRNPKRRYTEYLNDDFAKGAFQMHAPTYLENGLDKLPIGDLWEIGTTPWEEFVPGLGEHLRDTYGQALDVTPAILEDIFFERIPNAAKDTYQRVPDAIRDIFN